MSATKEALEIEKIKIEIEEIRVRINKMMKETTLYPLVVGSGATLAIVAVAKLYA